MALDLTIGIAGSGGDGVILLGELLAKSAARAGLHATLAKSFGPQIRGGETSARVRVADRPLPGADHRLDALLLFHYDDMARFETELPLTSDTDVFVDALDDTPLVQTPLPTALHSRVRSVPFEELAFQSAATKLAKNMVAAGVLAEFYGWPDQFADVLTRRFSRHGAGVMSNNLLAFEAGRAYVRDHFGRSERALDWAGGEARHFLSGNEALSLGALASGCRFMAGYPISPASEILEWMGAQLPRFGGTCIQAEDEIAAVCMAIGASYGGVRAMTATSGPGFSLMQEALGLASMAEIPLVIANAQRCGPSTGIPTRTEQADLSVALHGGHGDAPRVVLAATTVGDCYDLACAAFEIAERYQLPVVLLSDQHLAQSQQTVERLIGADPAPARDVGGPLAGPLEEFREAASASPTEKYRRYALTDSGVSPMSLPGQPGGEYVAVGIEHDETGDPTSSPRMHQAMSTKRARKLEHVAADYPLLLSSGAPEPRLGLLTWGSSYGVCAEAARLLTVAGLPTCALAPHLLQPLPAAQLQQWIDGLEQLVVVELNYSGQFYRHLRAWLDLPRSARQLNRAGGTPLSLTEVLAFARHELPLPDGFNTAAVDVVLSGRPK